MPHTFSRLWRPSPRSLLGAGLFATDRLRLSPAAWADATFHARAVLPPRVVLRPRVEPPLCDRHLVRPPRGLSMRKRLSVFLLFVAVLVLLPAVLAQVLS